LDINFYPIFVKNNKPMSLEEGRLIRQARKKSGYTQLELCKKLGLSHAPINQVENGWESISLFNLRMICEAVGLEVVIKEKHQDK
jgi:transcriptional regulator with XRE-family HTH domain